MIAQSLAAISQVKSKVLSLPQSPAKPKSRSSQASSIPIQQTLRVPMVLVLRPSRACARIGTRGRPISRLRHLLLR